MNCPIVPFLFKGAEMKIERAMQERLRMLKFDDVLARYQGGKLGCEGAAELLGIEVRTFLRWRKRDEETGGNGWEDRRVGRQPPRKAADAEVDKITRLYRDKYNGFNVAHFHAYLYWEEGFGRSYSWVKRVLCTAGLVAPGKRGGDHRLRLRDYGGDSGDYGDMIRIAVFLRSPPALSAPACRAENSGEVPLPALR